MEKGSITVDGVSLTVVSVADDRGGVHGLADPSDTGCDHAGQAGVGEQVNLEVDMVAKYVERMLGT